MRPAHRRHLATAVLLPLLALAVVACAGTGPVGPSSSPSFAPTPVGPPATLPPPQTSGPESPTATPAPPTSGDTVVRDDSLLALLPPDIDGTPVTVEDASFAEA
ncbi:MAG TPA: hypothetical protein VFQ75_03835, partial [Candidatus Limnocylindrales bacterium]|nr:hypothetical protein [Candidatus Limnocylindrales bacterium]